MNCYPTIDCPYKEDIEALAEEQVAERYDDYLQDVDVDADIHWQEHRLWVETDTPLMRETWILVGTTLTMLPTDDPDVPALAAAALAARTLDSGSDRCLPPPRPDSSTPSNTRTTRRHAGTLWHKPREPPPRTAQPTTDTARA